MGLLYQKTARSSADGGDFFIQQQTHNIQFGSEGRVIAADGEPCEPAM